MELLMAKPKKPATYSLFQRLSLFFFKRTRTTVIIWLLVTVFGIASYTTLLDREGFPSINTPFALAQGTYLVNDPQKVDKEVAAPMSEFLLKQSGVKTVQTQSFDNFYTTMVSYNEDVDATTRSQELQKSIEEQNVVPDNATVKLEAFKFGLTERGDDLAISFYAKDANTSTQDLVTAGQKAAEKIKSKNLSLVEEASIISPYETATNPLTGQAEQSQQSFERFGTRENNQNSFYSAVLIGINAKDDADKLELDKEISGIINDLNKDPELSAYHLVISGSDAPLINAQIDELQKTLLEGLLAVLLVGSLVIAIRASLITVLSMVTVIAIVNGLLFLFGYTLNTITLFALILGLSLIVDDTIIMVEALDAQRRKRKDAREAVEVATGKVGRAMIAATSTAALSFAPLLFVGGILGTFIRSIPITIISALITSLFVALIFIPLFARYLLLGKNQMGKGNAREVSANIEAAVARFVSAPMIWARNSKAKLFGVGITAVLIGLSFIGASAFLFQKVTFNIFPSSKDTNQISATITYPANTDIEQAQRIASEAEKKISDTLGDNFVKAAYFGQADIQKATLTIDLTDYKERVVKAPELVEKINNEFESFNQADVKANQIDAGPPASDFTARINSSQNREAAARLADDIAAYMKTVKLERPDGTNPTIEAVAVGNSSIYNRDDNKPYIQVSAGFKDTDTTTLVTLAQQAIEKEFPDDRVASYGLDRNAISFDFGQESENQDSFKTLALAFPIVLGVIYVLLAVQFRSLLQPLLIFLAIPFSLFGITLGLYLTDNAFSFFAMLGFFALIGLSIKNTILLTDYANQSRRAGMDAIDAAHEALAERFRPLIATSLTAVVSLIPLAITAPFWEGLAVVLIFGLLSSTFLVVTVFPYYYLGAEYLRSRISRAPAAWLALSVALAVILALVGLNELLWIAPIASLMAVITYKRQRRQRIAS